MGEKTNMDKMLSAIMEYDIPELKKMRQRNDSMLAANPVLYVEQAGLSYYLGEYVEAYRYLQKGTNIFYQQRKYVWYLVC